MNTYPTAVIDAITVQKIDQLNEEAWELRASDTARSRELAERAFRYAGEVPYLEGLGYSLANLARANHYAGENAIAARQIMEAIDIFEGLEVRSRPYCYALATLGMIHSYTNGETEALQISGKLLGIAQEEGYLDYQVSSLISIGSGYSHLGDYYKALEAYAKALPICKETGDRMTEGVIYIDRAIEYRELARYEDSIESLEQAREIFTEIDQPDMLVAAMCNLGETYLAKGENGAALCLLRDAEARARKLEVHARRHTLAALYLLGTALKKENQLQEACDTLKEALELSVEYQTPGYVFRCCEQLAALCEQAGQYEKALEYYRRFHEVKEELSKKRTEQRIYSLMVIHQTETARQTAEKYRMQHESQLKLREQDLAHYESMINMKDYLIHTASHDLKNPLTIIRLYADNLRRQLPPDAKDLHKFVDRIDAQTMRMRDLITDVLELAALDARQDEYEAINISDLVKQVANELKVTAERKHHRLEVFSASPATVVYGHSRQLWRAFQNLLTNAIKYTPEKGRITVTLQAAPDKKSVVIVFQDTGAGIPENDLPLIFEMFYRVKNEACSSIEGTGLGLSIVKKIIEGHQGTINVTSQVNIGTRFEITLPLRPRDVLNLN